MINVLTEIGKIIDILNSKTVSFTGYRPMKCPWGFNEDDERCVKMKYQLKNIIENCINDGYDTFISGMALGFDMICAETVLELRKKYKNIKLIAALPCANQSAKWNSIQQKRYNKILKKVNNIRCIYKEYNDTCMHERNRFMINNSSLVIALFDGKPGGTQKTVEYAKKLNKKVIFIKP